MKRVLVFTIISFILISLLHAHLAEAQGVIPKWGKALGVYVTASATDQEGNLYVGGIFEVKVVIGSFLKESKGGFDVFVAKFDAMGNIQWLEAGGGDFDDYLTTLIVKDNNIYVGGEFWGSTFDWHDSDENLPDTYSLFVARLNSDDGKLVWLTGGGGDIYHKLPFIQVSDNFVWVAGYFRGSFGWNGTPDDEILKNEDNIFDQDLFIVRLNIDNGEYTWLTGGGGDKFDYLTSLQVNNNFVYVAGYFKGASFVLSGEDLAGSDDTFVAKFRIDGGLVWLTGGGGNGNDHLNSLEIDNAGNVYVAGDFNSSTFVWNDEKLLESYYNVFVARLNSDDGKPVWLKGGGGNGNDHLNSLEIDNAGNVYVAGDFNSSVFKWSGEEQENEVGVVGISDVFVARLNSNDGGLVWLTGGGGNGNDHLNSLEIDNAGNVYVAGGFYSLTFQWDNPNPNLTNLGENDLFVARLNSNDGKPVWLTGGGGDGDDHLDFLQVVDASILYVIGIFQSTSLSLSNINLNQLSDDSGDTGYIIRLLEDYQRPVVTNVSFPENFALVEGSVLTLSLEARDEGSGISLSQFGYVGINSGQEITLAPIEGDGATYTKTFAESELREIDTEGIRYQFSFTDSVGNTTDTIGVTYWEDYQPPIITNVSFPDTFALEEGSELTLSLEARDEGSGIRLSQFGYVGLSSEVAIDEIPLTDIAGNEATYTQLLAASNLSTIDELGIRYRFVFIDEEDNESDTTGVTYWVYEDNDFSSTESPAGPWREIGNKTESYSVADYNIVAFPFEAQPVNAVLATLGASNDSLWRLFQHEAGKGDDGFVEYKNGTGGFSNFAPLRGYFLILRENDNIQFGGQIAEMDTDAKGYPVHHSLTLKEGWNLIGNPFPFAISWEAVKTANSSVEIGNLNLLTSSGYTDGQDNLRAFEGAFVFHQGADLTIRIPPSVRSGNNNRLAPTKPKAEGWQLNISVASENMVNHRNGLGMLTVAKDGWDIYDAVQLPKLAGYAELIIREPETDILFNRSIVSDQLSYTWQAEVVGSKMGEVVTLSWDAQLAASLPQPLYLWDATHNRLINLGEQAEYSLQTSEKGGLPLQIYYGPGDKLIEVLDIQQVQVGAAFPNPASHTVKLPVLIPEDHQSIGEVIFLLYDSRGQQVGRNVISPLSAGYHELTIDMPETLGGGLYLYRLQIQERVYRGRIVKY